MQRCALPYPPSRVLSCQYPANRIPQLLTPDGSIVLMEQREKTTPSEDTESQYGAWPGSADLREAIKDLACGEVGLAVALGAFDQ